MFTLAAKLAEKPLMLLMAAVAAMATVLLGLPGAAVVIGAVSGAIVFCFPFIAFLTYLFFYYHPLFPHAPTLSGILALASLSTHFLLTKHRLQPDNPFFLLICVALAIVASALWNGSLWATSGNTILHALFVIPLYLFMTHLIDSPKKLRFLVGFIICLGILQALIGHAELLIGSELFSMGHQSDELIFAGWTTVRPTGSVSDPNIYALYQLYCLPLIIGATLRARSLQLKWLLVGAGCFIMSGIFISYTRSAYLTLVILFLILILRNISPRNMLFFVLFIMALSAALTFQGGIFIKRFISLNQIGKLQELATESVSVAGRYRQYKLFADLILEKPILGIGAGNFYQQTYQVHVHAKPGEEVANIFMNLAMDAGLIGLGAYLWLLWITWRRLRLAEIHVQARGDRDHAILLRSLKYAFVGCMISTQTISGNYLFPIFISIGFASVAERLFSAAAYE